MDLHKAYYQIPVAPADVIKRAVTIPFGLFEYVFMPIGLRNAAQSFQRYICQALGELDFVFIYLDIYLDDMLVFSSSPEEHEEHVRIVLDRLKKHGLCLNLAKCEFGKPEIGFLGHLINHEGSRPTKERVQAILDFPRPSVVEGLHRFLGTVSFYRLGVPHAAEVQAPLHAYTHNAKKNDQTPIEWTPEAIQAFEQTNDLANYTLLNHPSMDAETRLVTDASDFAMGAALEQLFEGVWKLIAFFSRKFSKSQLNYSAYDRELNAIYEAIKYFKYLWTTNLSLSPSRKKLRKPHNVNVDN